jgi:hypothetical protein
MEDLGDTVQETVRKANKVLDAAAAAKVLEGLGIGSGGSSEVKQIAEAFSGLATGLKGIGELQAAVLGQVKETLGNGNGKSSIADLIGLVLVTKMLEPKEEKGVQVVKDVFEVMKELVQNLREEIRELKESRGLDPVNQQFQNLTMQLLSNHIATLTDPFAGIMKLAEAKDVLKSVLGETNGTPPEYSEGALRLKAIEKEVKGMELEHEKHYATQRHELEKLEKKHKMYAELIQQGAIALANAFGAYGLIPTKPLQFDPGAAEAAQKMAENVG